MDTALADMQWMTTWMQFQPSHNVGQVFSNKDYKCSLVNVHFVDNTHVNVDWKLFSNSVIMEKQTSLVPMRTLLMHGVSTWLSATHTSTLEDGKVTPKDTFTHKDPMESTIYPSYEQET